MPLLLLLVVFAIADLVSLFSLGAKIGLLASLAWIVVSAACGIHLIRKESFLTLQRARARFARGEIPSDELLAGASFVLAGVMLVAPGFLSDIVGLLCLLPGSGQLFRRWFGRAREDTVDADASVHHDRHQTWQRHHSDDVSGTGRPRQGETLEGDFVAKDEPRH